MVKTVLAKEKERGSPKSVGNPSTIGLESLKVSGYHIWVDLLAAGLAADRLDGQPLSALLTLKAVMR